MITRIGMGTKELRDKYGGNSVQAINRAIREELLGGTEVLEALDRVHKMAVATHHPLADEALELLRSASDAMRAEIRRRYDMPPES
jgi:hypothetical protein